MTRGVFNATWQVDLEDAGGVAFMRRWDEWMGAKLLVQRAEASASATSASATPPSATELAAARAVLESIPRQAAVAEPLLQDEPTLASLLPPPTAEELAALSAQAAAARSTPRPIHFGHEDVMRPHEAPPAPPPEEEPPHAHDDDAGAALQPVAAFAPWAFEEEEEEGGGGAPRLAEVIFADGSRCSCTAGCGRDVECCDAWEVRCT
jgi:hypothetical protein